MFSSKTIQLFSLLFVLMFAIIIGDNVSETLILTFYSAEQLSLMFMVNAIGLFFISLMVIGAIDKVPRFRLFLYILLSQCVILLFIRFSIEVKFKQAFLLLFCFAYIGKILLFLAFWTVANDLCDSREAKKLFPIIGSSGVLGGTLACFSTAYLVGIFGPANLLLLWIGLLLVALYLVYRLNRTHKKELSLIVRAQSQKSTFFSELRQNIGLVSKEPLLKAMSILYFITFFLLINLDFHFFISLKSHLTALLTTHVGETNQLAIDSMAFKTQLSTKLSSFLGIFRGSANSLTFFIQIGMAGYILRKLGTAKAMFIMPAIFTIVFLFCFLQSRFSIFTPAIKFLPFPFSDTMFLIVIGGTAARMAMFDSIFSPNFQIFFSSLPVNIRGRGKMFIEGLTKPLAILLAGSTVLWVGRNILKDNPEYIWVHFLILFLIGLGLCFTVLFLQKSYTDSISGSLGGNKAEQIAKVLRLDNWQNSQFILDILIIQIFDPDEDVRLFSIETLCQLDSEKANSALMKVLALTAYKNRPELICALGRNARFSGKYKEIEALLWDKDEKIIAATIQATQFLPFTEIEHLIHPYVKHGNPRISTCAIRVLWKQSGQLAKKDIYNTLESLLLSRDKDKLKLVLLTLSQLADPELLSLVESGRTNLQEVAGLEETEDIYIECLACFHERECLEKVLDFLVHKNEVFRKKIFHSLLDHVGIIQDYVPRWMEKLSDMQRHFLFELLFRAKFVGNHALKNLFMNQLRLNVKEIHTIQAQIIVLREQPNQEAKLLKASIEEGPLYQRQLNIVHLIALSEKKGNLFYVAPRLVSKDKFHKATAMEAIETSMPRDIHERISHIFLESNMEKIKKKLKDEHQISFPCLLDTIKFWAGSQTHLWAMTCALFYLISKFPEEASPAQRKQFEAILSQ